MKKFLLTAVSFVLLTAFVAHAQCIPDVTITSGIYPDPVQNLPFAFTNTFYETAVQFFVPYDTTYNGTYVTLTKFTITSVTGLPPGFTYSCTPSNCEFPSLTNGCVYISGTPTAAQTGTWYLNINITATGKIFGWLPTTQSVTFSDYKIKVFGPPVSAFQATPVSVCKGSNVVFDNNSSNKPVSYQWLLPGGTPAFSTDTNPTVTYNVAGNYDVTLVTSNPAGTDTLNKVNFIHVRDLPDTTITLAGNDTVCAGQTITLHGVSQPYYSYQWYRFLDPVAGATASDYTATQKGWYKVMVTNTNNGCTNSSVPHKIVIENPPVDISLSGPLTFCRSQSVTLTAPVANGYTYQWYRHGTPIIGETASSYTTGNEGKYKVKITNSAGCFRTSDSYFVEVNQKPTASVIVTIPAVFCPGDTVHFSAYNGPGYTFQWKRFGEIIPGATAMNYDATEKGRYRVTVVDANGCSAVSPVTHIVANCRTTNTVETAEEASLILFPNPATSHVNMEYTSVPDEPVFITVTDATGRVVKSGNVLSDHSGKSTYGFSVTNLARGIYQVHVASSKENRCIKLVVANE